MSSKRPRPVPVATLKDGLIKVDIFEPTATFGYYRLAAYHPTTGERVASTSGGTTREQADRKAQGLVEVVRTRFAGTGARVQRNPDEVLVHDEIELWLVPENHRTRQNRPWTQRHADNMLREWRMRIAPHIPANMPVSALNDRTLWVRILNEAPTLGAHSPDSVQKTGQACRSFITWLMSKGLLTRNPMEGVQWVVTAAQKDGREPLIVSEREIPSSDQVVDLGWAMAWRAWRGRPGRGGERRPDQVGTFGRGLHPVVAARTGLRLGEQFALRADDIDLHGREVRVRETLVEEDSGHQYFSTPKNGKQRITIVVGDLMDDLQEFIEFRRFTSGERNPLLFCAALGGLETRRNHSRRFQAGTEMARWPMGLEWRGLRHHFAVMLMAPPPGGLNLTLEEASKLLGHYSPDFTARRYLVPRSGWLERAAEASATLAAAEAGEKPSALGGISI